MKKCLIGLLLLTSTIAFGQNQWTTVKTFDEVSGTVNYSPIIASNNSNLAAVAWVQDDKPYVSVFLNGSWETPVALSTTLTDEVDLCIDESGNITVGALSRNPTNLVTSFLRPAGSLSWTEQVIFNPGDNTLQLQDLSISCTEENAQAIFVWVDTKDPNQKIQSKYRKNGVLSPSSVLSATVVLDSTPPTPNGRSDPIVKMLPDGTAHVVFLGENIADFLYTSDFNPNTISWGNISLLGFSMTGPADFDFAMNDSGDAIVIGYGNGENPLYTYRSEGAWAIPDLMGVSNPETMNVAIDNNSLVTVTWVDNATQEVFVRSAPVTALPSDWDAGLSNISTSSSNSLSILGTSQNGILLVGWDNTTAGNAFQVRESINGGTLSSIETIDLNTSPARISVNNNGNAYATWVGTLSPKLVKVSIFMNPVTNLSKALGKKRLVYQKGTHP